MNVSAKISEICNRMEKNYPGFIDEYNDVVDSINGGFMGISETTRIALLEAMIAGIDLGFDRGYNHGTK